MNAFRFADPGWGVLVWAVVGLAAVLVWLDRRARNALCRLVSEPLRSRLVAGPPASMRLLRIALLACSCLFLVVALMRPQWGLHFVATPRVGAEIMIALDVSRSMLAEDVAPNRLERAKADLRDLLPYLEGDEVGLIAFAGRATVLSPLTPDFGFLRLTLDGAGPGSVSRGGTNLAEPILKAVAGFGGEGEVSRSILLVTDGEDHDSYVKEAVRKAAERGIKILAVGFGDENGSRIEVTDPETGARSLVRDADGKPVISRLDGELLRELARTTHGAYVPAGTGVLDLEAIYSRHIAPLTRGRLAGKGRGLRNEGFPWAVLAALLCLLAAVSTTGARAVAGGLALLLVLGLASAQAASASKGLRERYNQALEKLAGGDLDAAEKALQEAREQADTDGELRYRATYNLAWVEVRRAESQTESDPEQALQALGRAADWFRRAVRLRPADEDARRNLELVARRARILADSLAEAKPDDLASRLARLIEDQRALVSEAGGVLESLARAPERESLRDTLRDLSAKALERDSEAQDASQTAAEEAEGIAAKDPAEVSPEEATRAVRVEAVGRYLHRGRERLGQARGALRRRDAARGFRRLAAALGEFKRARDQLLDPVTVLDAVIADAMTTARSTSERAAADTGLEAVSAPAWLTHAYLAERESDIEQRIRELASGFDAALEHAAQAYDGGQAMEPRAMSLLEAVSEAAPLLAEAAEAAEEAAAALEGSDARAALPAEQRCLQALLGARERFLDLRRLVELLYRKQAEILMLLDPEAGEDRVTESVPLAEEVQDANLQRVPRVRRALTDALRALETPHGGQSETTAGAPQDEQGRAAQRTLLEKADPLLDAAEARMREAGEVLAAASARLARGSGGLDAESLRKPLEDARAAAAELRRLFFSVLDHLREIASLQAGIGDRSAELATLAAYAPGPEIATGSGRLAPEQSALAGRAEQVAAALQGQAAHLRQRAAAPGADAASSGRASGAAPSEPRQADPETLEHASTYVSAAASNMHSAYNGLTIDPPQLLEVREDQQVALENLQRAISLLEPPRPRKPEAGNQQDAGGGKDTGGEQNRGQDRHKDADPGRQLQGIRDREAQRRAARARGRSQAGYEPVEKDW